MTSLEESLNMSYYTPLYKNEQKEREIIQWRLLMLIIQIPMYLLNDAIGEGVDLSHVQNVEEVVALVVETRGTNLAAVIDLYETFYSQLFFGQF